MGSDQPRHERDREAVGGHRGVLASCRAPPPPLTSPRRMNGSDSYDLLVVGAGYAGSVIAERFASQQGARVLVVDRRDHIAGNAYDYVDDHGVLVHKYGPHIFHTNAMPVVDYLSQFTEWMPYEHRVVAEVQGQRLPMPINRDTVNRLYGLDLKSEDE